MTQIILPHDADLIPMPSKSLVYRGMPFSRCTIYRLADAGEIKTTAIRLTGSSQRRRMILRESLDAFLNRQIAEGMKHLTKANATA